MLVSVLYIPRADEFIKHQGSKIRYRLSDGWENEKEENGN